MAKFELEKEIKMQAIDEIRKFFLTERDENIGDLAAELILDFFTEKIASYFYNEGIRDAHKYMYDKLEDMFGLERL
mgnify:CR=1 FL=1